MTASAKRAIRPRFPTRSALLPTILQDATDGTVLGLAYSNRASWARLRRSKDLILFSRSRKRLWRKGATSGNTAKVVATRTDCDGDALLVRVIPRGPFCHTGTQSCFDSARRRTSTPSRSIVAELERLIETRRRTLPSGSYTAALLQDEERRLKKVGEEATEVVVAATRNDREAVVRESADLVYHLLVVYSGLGVYWKDVEACLAERRRGPAPSGKGRRRTTSVVRSRSDRSGTPSFPP